MNSERVIYIRAIRQNQPGLHRVGALMFTPVDSITYITASLCNPCDKFSRAAAIGKCRQTRIKAQDTVHYLMDGGKYFITVDKTLFARPANTTTDVISILKNLGIYNAMLKHYANMIDYDYLNAIVSHELSHV